MADQRPSGYVTLWVQSKLAEVPPGWPADAEAGLWLVFDPLAWLGADRPIPVGFGVSHFDPGTGEWTTDLYSVAAFVVDGLSAPYELLDELIEDVTKQLPPNIPPEVAQIAGALVKAFVPHLPAGPTPRLLGVILAGSPVDLEASVARKAAIGHWADIGLDQMNETAGLVSGMVDGIAALAPAMEVRRIELARRAEDLARASAELADIAARLEGTKEDLLSAYKGLQLVTVNRDPTRHHEPSETIGMLAATLEKCETDLAQLQEELNGLQADRLTPPGRDSLEPAQRPAALAQEVARQRDLADGLKQALDREESLLRSEAPTPPVVKRENPTLSPDDESLTRNPHRGIDGPSLF